ncbi:MAG TPA: autotransporter-associated beta strand repeat-containing protein, partial [Verrucomicrobiae bacterium]|nr:autotransporter-associated beta strand repeat-containing protein [Verrucomicrobiae bacterium]
PQVFAQQVVWSDGANTCGNPTVVQDRANGRLWLFLTWNNGNDSQTEIQNFTSIDVRKIYSCYSDNDGATWSAPVNRFAEVQPANTRWDATGPGCGIQMVNGVPGRLIIPANNRNIYSDDHGLTWNQSASLPGGSSESQEVEISGGVLLRNDRAAGGNAAYNARIFCRSSNQGASWGALEVRQDLTCPVCQASTITVNHPSGLNGRMLVFSNPSSTTRDHMTIKCSLDDGVTWPFSQLVYSGSSAYSCLTRLGTNSVGLLYERDGYGKITFDKFAMGVLVPNPPGNQPPQTWDGGAGTGNETWQQANNWSSNSTPVFDSGLDVIFNTSGAVNLTNAIGADRTIRSLTFSSNADSDVSVYLAEKISSPATNQVLTFDGFLGNASNTVASGAMGNFIIGVGGAGGLGAITLANNLVVTHNGGGELRFDRPISGPGGITKNGSGILFLRQSNPYTGSTVINAGVVVTGGNSGGFGDASTCGPMFLNGGTLCNSTAASRPIYNHVTIGGNFSVGGVAAYGSGLLTFSGAVDLGGATRTLTINSPVTLAGVVSNGGLTKNGTGTLTLTGANTYTGQNTLFAGTVQLGDGSSSGSLADASAIAIGPNATFQFNRTNSDTDFPNNFSGTGTILKSVGGAVEFGLTGMNSFSGLIDIQAGKISFAGADSENGAPSVNIASGATLSIGSSFIGGTATIANLTGAGGIDPAFNSGAGTRTLQISQSSDGVFSGVMADATSGRVLALKKSGPATLTLSGTNTYTGPTTVNDGTLLINGSISNSVVTVQNGAALGGIGFIGGAVIVVSGGTLSPGVSVGTLTISNSLTLAGTTLMEVNSSNGQCDHIQGLTSLAYGGTLVVSNLAGTITNGQSFQLFSVPANHSGNFSSITPSLDGGLAWSFNPTNGLLTVVSTTATYPTSLNLTVSGGILSLAWPSTHLGWIAQSNSTDLSSPGNWFDIPGTSTVTNLNIIPSPAQTSVWYRLRSP